MIMTSTEKPGQYDTEVSVSLDEELAESLKKIAASELRTMEAQALFFVREALKSREERREK